MTRHLFPRAHLPHPHIAEHLAAVFGTAAAPIIPDGHDWTGYHYPEGEGYAYDPCREQGHSWMADVNTKPGTWVQCAVCGTASVWVGEVA